MELNRRQPEVEILKHARLIERAAERIAQTCARAAAERGRCLLAVSGGGTPGPVYALLASARFARAVPWQAVHFLWGDDRCVPPEHEASNYRLVKDSGLLERPLGGVHRMRGEIAPEEAAAEYEGVLRTLRDEGGTGDEASPEDAGADPGAGRPAPGRDILRIDLALNGMGEDGHTASLFPGSPELEEERRWVVATAEHQGFRRLSLTLPVFEAAREVLFLIEGEGKAEPLSEVLSGRGAHLPTGRLLACVPVATLLLDPEAASSLESPG